MGGDTLSKQERSKTMSAVLARPRQSAPLRLHLNHFLKFVTKIGSRVNAHKELLVETLHYLLSLAKNPTYKKRILAALDKVRNTVEERQPCKNDTDILLFYTEFAIMSECMYHCEKLKGRAPKILTKKQWNNLQKFMSLKYYSKVDNTMQGLWMSVTNKNKEGEWRDF